MLRRGAPGQTEKMTQPRKERVPASSLKQCCSLSIFETLFFSLHSPYTSGINIFRKSTLPVYVVTSVTVCFYGYLLISPSVNLAAFLSIHLSASLYLHAVSLSFHFNDDLDVDKLTESLLVLSLLHRTSTLLFLQCFLLYCSKTITDK